MPVIVAEGEVVVTADAAGLGRDINREIDSAGNGAEASGKGIGGKVFGGVIGAWAAIGAAEKITGFIGSSIMAGSDLNETVSKSAAIFGEQAGAIESWASTASTSLGLSKSAALASASSFGDMFSQIGFTGDAAAEMSTSVVQAAADLGSFNNLDTADVSDRISAAFRGEYDSLQAVIPNINAARVESEAMAATGKTTAASLTAQEKATAVMAIVTADGARAMGDFGKTSGGLANQMKIAAAQTEDLKGRVGSALQPALQSAAAVLTGTVMPAFLGLADKAGPAIASVIAGIGGIKSILVDGDFTGSANLFGLTEDSGTVDFLFNLRDTIGEVMGNIGGVLSSFGAGFSTFLAPLMGVGAALIPTFLQLATSVSPFAIVLQGIAPIANTLGAVLGQVALVIANTLYRNLTTLTPVLTEVATSLSTGIATILPVIIGLLPTVATLFGTVAGVVSQILAAVLPLVSTLVSMLVPVLAQIVTAVVPVVASLVGLVATAIVPLVNTVLSVLMPVIQALLPVVTTVFGVIVSVITAALQVVQGIIQVVTGIITGNWKQVWTGLGTIVSGAWNLIKSVVTGAINIVRSVISAGINIVKSLWAAGWNAIGGAVRSAAGAIGGAVGSLVSTVQGRISAVVGFFRDLPGQIIGFLGGLAGSLAGAGRNMIEGLIGGVKSVAGRIKDAVLGPIKNSVEAVKSFLGIASPSRLFRNEIGVMMGRGLMGGWESTLPAVTSSLVGGMQSAVGAVSGSLPAMASGLTAAVDIGGAVGGGLGAANQGGAGATYIDTLNVTVDAKNVKEFSDLVALFGSIGQASRTGSVRGKGALIA